MAVKKSTAPKSSAKAAPKAKAAPRRPLPRQGRTQAKADTKARPPKAPKAGGAKKAAPKKAPVVKLTDPQRKILGEVAGKKEEGLLGTKANAKQLARPAREEAHQEGQEGRRVLPLLHHQDRREAGHGRPGRSLGRGLVVPRFLSEPASSPMPMTGPNSLWVEVRLPPACLDLQSRLARGLRNRRKSLLAMSVLAAKIRPPSWPGHVPAIPYAEGPDGGLGLSGSDRRCVREGMRSHRESGRSPGARTGAMVMDDASTVPARDRRLRTWLLAVVVAAAGCSTYVGTTAKSFLSHVRTNPDPNVRYLAYSKLASSDAYDTEEQKGEAVDTLIEKFEHGQRTGRQPGDDLPDPGRAPRSRGRTTCSSRRRAIPRP